MSGYWTSYGYIGFVNGIKRLFASDTEYYEFMEELCKTTIKGELNHEQTYDYQQDA